MTLLGTLASALGGALLGLSSFLTSITLLGGSVSTQWPLILIGAFSGFLGSLVPRTCPHRSLTRD